jgi:CBS domain-containing protein
MRVAMKTIGQLLHYKGCEIWSITPEEKVFDALKLMAEKDIGALLVLEEGNLVGIFSERDYARKVILEGKSSKTIPVCEIMTTELVCGCPEQTVEQALALMNAKHVRHLPIVEGGRLIGIVTIGDLVKAVISEKEDLIYFYEMYIHGTPCR